MSLTPTLKKKNPPLKLSPAQEKMVIMFKPRSTAETDAEEYVTQHHNDVLPEEEHS